MKSTLTTALLLFTGILTLNAQDQKGFRFSGGDVELGSDIFVAVNCVQCHSLKGVHMEQPADKKMDLVLGEDERFVKKYEDIITAITQPKHVVNKQYEAILTKTELEEIVPFMENFTERLTVRQLIDLVTFLDKVYSNASESYGKQ